MIGSAPVIARSRRITWSWASANSGDPVRRCGLLVKARRFLVKLRRDGIDMSGAQQQSRRNEARPHTGEEKTPSNKLEWDKRKLMAKNTLC